MPFDKYLQNEHSDQSDYSSTPDYSTPAFSHGIQFQLPSFITPTLAPGGGAEALPFNSKWFANNGFTNTYTPPSSVSPDKPPIQLISAPSPLGLPVYSASGFDVLSILGRVATRPNPRVILGPVDLTCSFVVVDIRRYDHPIVYCSPTFCHLTGYDEHEILGRNCRFLQAPGGAVRRGDPRRFTSQHSVNVLRKALAADKEVQTSVVNFRKDGSAFINLVSVIPITGGVSGGQHELNDIVYHVGFQVDLTEQPNAILEKLRDGSYLQNQPAPPTTVYPTPPSHDEHLLAHPRRIYTIPQVSMSPLFATLLQSKSFLRSLPISTSTTAPPPLPSASSAMLPTNPLSPLLLEYAPDFVHVVSLKGAFLYVSPAVTRILGYTPAELIGRALADLAHPEDVVPLERQLKESSALLPPPLPSCSSNSNSSPPSSNTSSNSSCSYDDPQGLGEAQGQKQARSIDVLFRARTKSGVYVWVECRGRMHVEPGKGRKAIVLSGRARAMPKICWGDVVPPLSPGAPSSSPASLEEGEGLGTGTKTKTVMKHREFWAQLAGKSHGAGAVVGAGEGVRDVLGYTPDELLGTRLGTLVVDGESEGDGAAGVREALSPWNGKEGMNEEGGRTMKVWARLRTKMGGTVRVLMVFYRSGAGGLDVGLHITPAEVLVQIRLVDDGDDGESATLSTSMSMSTGGGSETHDPEVNVFADLEVSRGSSWQYELQQLRFKNGRLREEVEGLEAEVAVQVALGKGKGKSKGKAQENGGEEGKEEHPAALEPESLDFSDLESAGLGVGVGLVYPDVMGVGVGMGMGMNMNMNMNMVGRGGGGGGGGGEGKHANYSIALERYAAGRGFGGLGGSGGGGVGGGGDQMQMQMLMPPPLLRPSVQQPRPQPLANHVLQQQQQQRPQTPANHVLHHHHHQQTHRQPSLSLHRQQPQQQQLQQQQQQDVYAPGGLPQEVYAPVPLSVQRARSMSMSGVGMDQYTHQPQHSIRAPSRLEERFQAHLRSLPQQQQQFVTSQQQLQDWGTLQLHQGVKRPLER